MTVRATLVTDGSSDVAFLPLLRWLVGGLTTEPFELKWGDLRGMPRPPKSLTDRLILAVELYPCHLLFVHRDAEKRDPQRRRAEIDAANLTALPHVCVIPVRMQEAWLLHDECALRLAAECPSGTTPLNLPACAHWESLPDPKGVLHGALRLASGAKGRRAKKFRSWGVRTEHPQQGP